MIVKERTIPLKIQAGEALLRRYPKHYADREELQKEMDRRWAGYWGEQSLDYYLGFLDEKKYMIFHDLNLPMGEYTFQIDTLVLSSYFVLIIEAKNIAGSLFFDKVFHQLIRTNSDGSEEGFADPISQVRLHELQLGRFFEEHRLPKVPIEYAVVMCNKYSILKTNPGNRRVFEKVYKAPHLMRSVQHLESIYQREVLSQKELQKISRTLLKKNTPPKKFFMDRYLLSKNQLRSGIHCPSCFSIPVHREKRQWHCQACGIYSKDAHLHGLRDYFLLIDTKISIQEFREFAGLDSRDVASRLLASTNFPSSGTTKDRLYHPPADLYSGEIVGKLHRV